MSATVEESAIPYVQYDRLTLVAVSALAFIVEVGLHEHAGHAAACLALGSQVTEYGAFYVNCNNTLLTDGGIRMVALAGPAMSLLTGIVALRILARLPREALVAQYFTWLVATVGLLSATGYPLFSGISGIGDFGGGDDGAFHGFEPEWLWRAAIALLGAGAYLLVAMICLRRLEDRLPGFGPTRTQYARRLLWISYFTGGVASVLVGLPNPHGAEILFESVLPGSMGATSALLWMPNLISRTRKASGAGFGFARDWRWIGAAFLIVAAYAAILGPTIAPTGMSIDRG